MRLVPKRKMVSGLEESTTQSYQPIDEDGIQPASITNIEMHDVSIDKLTAGDLSVEGTLISGGKFTTGDSPDPRIEITDTEIVGYSDATTKQFYLQASDGKGYFGAGACYLDSTGVVLSNTDTARLNFEYTGMDTSVYGKIYVEAATGNLLIIPPTVDLNGGYSITTIKLGGALTTQAVAPYDAGNNDCGDTTYYWRDVATKTITLSETTTPSADTNFGKVYTKTDNTLYFQDGAGSEKAIISTADVDDTPVNGATTVPPSSNWAYDHNAATTGVHGAGASTLIHSGNTIADLTAPAADFSMNNHKITSVTDPTSNQDAATKKYVDDNAGSTTFAGLTDATIAVKSADETVNNSTTLQNDDDLVLAVGANDIWTVEVLLRITTAAAADFDYQFTVPASGDFTGVTNAERNVSTQYSPIDLTAEDSIISAGALADDWWIIKGVYIGGGTAGNVQLQWAQHTADVSDTKVLKGSYLIAHKLA